MTFDYFYDHILTLDFLKTIGITLILFLLFREIVTWYWKLNEIVNLLKEIRENTRKEEIKEGVIPPEKRLSEAAKALFK